MAAFFLSLSEVFSEKALVEALSDLTQYKSQHNIWNYYKIVKKNTVSFEFKLKGGQNHFLIQSPLL